MAPKKHDQFKKRSYLSSAVSLAEPACCKHSARGAVPPVGICAVDFRYVGFGPAKARSCIYAPSLAIQANIEDTPNILA